MKSAKLMIVCLFAVVLSAMPTSADNHEENSKKYIAVPNGSAVGIWIVDVQTGKPVFCYIKGPKTQYKIICVYLDY